MSPQVRPELSADQRAGAAALLKDLRAAISYLSFYSADSPFVIQAGHRFHKGLENFLQEISPLEFKVQSGDLTVNDAPFSDVEVVVKALEEKRCPGFRVGAGVSYVSCVAFLKRLADPNQTDGEFRAAFTSEDLLRPFEWIETQVESAPEAAVPTPESQPAPTAEIHEPEPIVEAEASVPEAASPIRVQDPDGLVALVAEAWQLSQAVNHHMKENPQAQVFAKVFQRFFQHLLDRIGGLSPELGAIQGWFQCPQGEPVEDHMESAMKSLLSTAVSHGWTAVLYDPSTSGLVSECLAEWGANGRHELVEKTVEALAKGLQGSEVDRELALTHLMDSRPWVGNTRLLQVILDRLTAQLSEETDPALYQKGLLIAWDLLEPALEAQHTTSVLALLATLHMHADDEAPAFAERPALVRHWILGKSSPELVRRLVVLAQENGRLAHFPVLGMIAAPILMNDFFAASPEDVPKYLRAFSDMREQVQAVLVEKLPESLEEVEVRLLLLIIRTCGIDPALAFQLSAWVAKGSLELKYSIISAIEELRDPLGGPALRLAVLDDAEDVAVAAVRALVTIGFTPAAALMVKAAQMRRSNGKPHAAFDAAVCEALGRFKLPGAVPYLLEQARKKGFLSTTEPVAVRAAAIRALAMIDTPELWKLMEELAHEKNQELQVTLDEVIQSRRTEA